MELEQVQEVEVGKSIWNSFSNQRAESRCRFPDSTLDVTPMQWLEVIIARLGHPGEYNWSAWPRYVGTRAMEYIERYQL